MVTVIVMICPVGYVGNTNLSVLQGVLKNAPQWGYTLIRPQCHVSEPHPYDSALILWVLWARISLSLSLTAITCLKLSPLKQNSYYTIQSTDLRCEGCPVALCVHWFLHYVPTMIHKTASAFAGPPRSFSKLRSLIYASMKRVQRQISKSFQIKFSARRVSFRATHYVLASYTQATWYSYTPITWPWYEGHVVGACYRSSGEKCTSHVAWVRGYSLIPIVHSNDRSFPTFIIVLCYRLTGFLFIMTCPCSSSCCRT